MEKDLVTLVLPELPAILIILVIEHMAIAKSYGSTFNYTVIPSQEILAQGASNLLGTFVGGYVCTGSFGASAVLSKAGVRTPLAGLFSALMLILALYALTSVFYYIPLAALAGLIIHAVAGLPAEPKTLKKYWKLSPFEFIIWWAGVFIAIFISLEVSIYVTICVSLALYLVRTARAPGQFLAPVQVLDRHRQPHKGSSTTKLVPSPCPSPSFPSDENTPRDSMDPAGEERSAWVSSLNGSSTPTTLHDPQQQNDSPHQLPRTSNPSHLNNHTSQSSAETLTAAAEKAASLLHKTAATSKPRTTYLPTTENFTSQPHPGIFIYRFPAGFAYPNQAQHMTRLKDYIKKHTRPGTPLSSQTTTTTTEPLWCDAPARQDGEVEKQSHLPPLRGVILDCSAVDATDITSVQGLADARKALDRYACPDGDGLGGDGDNTGCKVRWYFAGLHNPWARRAFAGVGFGGGDDEEVETREGEEEGEGNKSSEEEKGGFGDGGVRGEKEDVEKGKGAGAGVRGACFFVDLQGAVEAAVLVVQGP